jgi:hypothetical protein
LGMLTSHLSIRVISNFTRKHHQRRNK